MPDAQAAARDAQQQRTQVQAQATQQPPAGTPAADMSQQPQTTGPQPPADTNQIRIEPFRPVVVPGGSENDSIAGQVFLLRHVQIEQRHFIQGFKLNEDELVRQVSESAGRHIVRRDMDFDVGRTESPAAVHTAILDFGFGELILNLFELKPDLIANQISMLRKGFFAVLAVVFVAVALAQMSCGARHARRSGWPKRRMTLSLP